MVALDFPSSPANGQTYGGYYWDSTTGAWRSDPVPMGGLPAGSIIQWAGATAPANWLMADGAAVSRTTYASLFAAIGTTYGAGDGSTTFNLPDLRGRVPVGKNAGTFSTLGATGGAESVTLTSAQSGLPAHTHGVSWLNNINVAPFTGSYGAIGSNAAGNVNANAAQDAAQAHTNLQPYLVTNYIIKATSGWTAGDSELATRVGALEAAPAGLVRVVPTSVAVGSGSASVSATGVVTFSGASSVSLNGCFSSSFTRYRVVIDQGASVSDVLMRYRYRVGTTDQSTAVYFHGGYVCYQQGTNGTNVGANQTEQFIGYNNAPGQGPSSTVMDISTYGYPTAVISTVGGHSAYGVGSWTLNSKAYISGVTTGITFLISSGTIAGNIQVYGYRN